MIPVLGVDACARGWVGVELHDGRFAAAHFGPALVDVMRAPPDAAAIVAVDIPLGLVESGWREADSAAKTYLGVRSPTLFLTPPRAALAEDTHARATARCRELTGNGFSIQAWGLKAKLLEANSLYDSGRYPLREVHPEVSFIRMGLRAVDGSKKTWRGQRGRLRVLRASGIELPDEVGRAGTVPTDDLLDAAAAAWSAHRIACGEGQSLPDPPQRNRGGQQIAIWF
jgi:predicted RNase H-like nuclease